MRAHEIDLFGGMVYAYLVEMSKTTIILNKIVNKIATPTHISTTFLACLRIASKSKLNRTKEIERDGKREREERRQTF